MGQQQLLLLVLGAVVVGMAIVVGINMFGEGEIKAQQDAVKQDLVTMAARVQEFWRKPAYLGGGGKSLSSLDNFTQIGYVYDYSGTAVTTTYINENAQYVLSEDGSGTITATLVQKSTDGGYEIVSDGPILELQFTEPTTITINSKLTFEINRATPPTE